MEAIDFIRIFFALATVLGLIGLTALVARRSGVGSSGLSINSHRRLSVSEAKTVDAQHRLIIVKCDDKEHLILLGKSGDTVIQANLDAPSEVAAPQSPPSFSEVVTQIRSSINSGNPFVAPALKRDSRDTSESAA